MRRLLLALCLAGAPAVAQAQGSAIRLANGGTVRLTAGVAPVQIRVGTGDSVTVSGGQLQREGLGAQITGAMNAGSPPLVVTVPSWTTLSVVSRTAAVSLEGSPQVLTVETTSGNIRLQNGNGTATLSSIAGGVSVTGFQGQVLTIDASGADVTVQNATGTVVVSSINGSIALASLRGSSVTASTVNGTVSLEGAFAPEGVYTVVSHNGGIALRLGPDQGARVQGTTIRGEVINEIGAVASARSGGGRGGRTGANRALTGAEMGARTLLFGNGGPTFVLTSFNGDITVSRSTP